MAATPAVAGEIVTAKVIDGDKFETSDGRKIRVLGIDSCEVGTYGGDQAKTAAEGQLTNTYNQPIKLPAQPCVDTDKYGRQLRYVQLDSGATDFGEFMVKYDHTASTRARRTPRPTKWRASTRPTPSTRPTRRRVVSAATRTRSPRPPSDGGSSYSYDGDDDYNMPMAL